MATLSLFKVRDIAKRKRPWTLRMECRDAASNTAKFWYATGRGLHEAVECGWGRIGNKAQTKLTDFSTFETKVTEKLRKGYEYVDTPFIRMSAKSLATLGGSTPSAPATATPAPAPAPQTTITGRTPQPPNLQNFPTPKAPPASTVTVTTAMPDHVNPSLPPPFGFIKWLKPAKGGGWDALDSNKVKLLDLTLAGGKTMLRDFPSVVEILA